MTGAVYQLAPATKLASKPRGEWNTFEIEAIGPNIKVKLNGEAVSELGNRQGRPLRVTSAYKTIIRGRAFSFEICL